MGHSEEITQAVTAWPGVEAGYGERGEWGFSVDGKQIGHLHGDRVAHFGFPRDAGRVGPHPVNRHSPKMAARELHSEEDVRDVIDLMRMNYDRITG
jgi:hypothetical protein